MQPRNPSDRVGFTARTTSARIVRSEFVNNDPRPDGEEVFGWINKKLDEIWNEVLEVKMKPVGP